MKLKRIITASFCLLISTFWLLSCTEENISVQNEQLRVKSFRLISEAHDFEYYNQVSYESNRIIITTEEIEGGISEMEKAEYSFNEIGDVEYYSLLSREDDYCADTAFYDYSNPQKIIKTWHIYNIGAPCELSGTQEEIFILNEDGTLKFQSHSMSPEVIAYETIDGNIVARYDSTDNFKKVAEYTFNNSVEVPENFELIYILRFSTNNWIDKNLVVEKMDHENTEFRFIKNEFVFDESGNITQVERYISYQHGTDQPLPDYQHWYTMYIEYETYD